jgi:Kyakuja-Dileera-Zisupton transposase
VSLTHWNVRWIYSLLITLDANFRLKLKDKRIKNDPPLGDGWGHWVEQKLYMEYIKKYGHQEEVSNPNIQQILINAGLQPNLCESELHAVDHANTKFSKGYKATGVGGAICARHSLVRKNGLGDLQKGERYVMFVFNRLKLTKS